MVPLPRGSPPPPPPRGSCAASSYDAQVPELINGRFQARRLMHKYNTYFPHDATAQSLVDERAEMLSNMFGHVGKSPFVEPPLNIDYGCNIAIGDSFYSNFK